MALLLGGFETPRSGAGAKKGDVHVDVTYMVEAKSTSKGSFTVQRGVLEKLRREALRVGMEPVFAFRFDPIETAPWPVDFVAVSADEFRRLCDLDKADRDRRYGLDQKRGEEDD